MQDIESYGLVSNEKKQAMFIDRIVAYLAILMTMLAFIFSCIGLNKATQSNLEKTLYTFSFPYFNQIPKVEPGVVVSLDTKGYVFTGAGTTISRNVTATDMRGVDEETDDVRVCGWNTNVIFTGTRGYLVAYEISEDDISIDNPMFNLPTVNGKPRNVEYLDKIGDDILVVVGSGYILAVQVNVKVISDTHFEVSFKALGDTKFSDQTEDAWPHCDELHDDNHHDMVACTWEDGANLKTGVFALTGEGESRTFKAYTPVTYGVRRQYHGLAGLGREGYVVASVGSMYNETENTAGPVRVQYVSIHGPEGRVSVSEATLLPFEISAGFFAMDNFGPNGAVLCYTRLASGGLNCVSMDVVHSMGPQGEGIVWGSTLTVTSGGSTIDVARTKLQMINMDTFAVMWIDRNVGGQLSYQMISFNEAGDMLKHGPAYVVSHRNRDHQMARHIIGCTGVDEYKSAIVELVQTQMDAKALLHTVYVYPRPIGVAAKNFAGGNQVQFGGLWKVSSSYLKQQRFGKLFPGTMYYTNDRGMILRGFPAGYAHRSFGIFYIVSRDDDSLLNLNNQVGMAISENEILLKFY